MGRITASRTQLKGDPRHDSMLAGKFINCLMLDGKKTTAQNVFYDALEEIARRNGFPEQIADRGLRNGDRKRQAIHRSPQQAGRWCQLSSSDAGQSSASAEFGVTLALDAVRDKKGRPMHLKLADELLAAYKKEGVAYTKRENTHRMADANKAFAHFAW